MRVNHTSAADQTARQEKTTRVKQATPEKGSFAKALAKASSTEGVPGQNSPETVNPTAPKNEKYQDVEGKRAYDEIIAGPRNGMFLNTSGNKRDGQAFTLVKREGRDIHIYGTGKNREIVVVWHDKLKAAAEAKAQAKADAEAQAGGTSAT